MSLFWMIAEVVKLPVSVAVTTLTCGMEAGIRKKWEPYVVSNVKKAAKEFSDMFDDD